MACASQDPIELEAVPIQAPLEETLILESTQSSKFSQLWQPIAVVTSPLMGACWSDDESMNMLWLAMYGGIALLLTYVTRSAWLEYGPPMFYLILSSIEDSPKSPDYFLEELEIRRVQIDSNFSELEKRGCIQPTRSIISYEIDSRAHYKQYCETPYQLTDKGRKFLEKLKLRYES